MSLGMRLRAALAGAGLSAEGASGELGVTGATVRRWCLGQREPDLETLKRFAALTGASLLWLIEGDAAPPSVSEWALRFADLVHAGVDPAAALAEVSAGAAALSEAEAGRLSAAAEGMRRVLDDLSPAPWGDLTLAQKREVLALIDRLGRESRSRRPWRRRS